MTFWVTLFDNVYATSCVGKEVGLEELAELMANTTAPDKASLPLLKLARFGSVRTPAPANSLRHDANVEMISGLEGDYDGEEMPLSEAVDRLEKTDVAFLAYSSPSHLPGKPRWRVLLPLSKGAPPAERARLMNGVNGMLGGVLSRESWGLSQSFYYGGVNGPPAELHIGDAERCVDEADLDAGAQPYRSRAGAAGGKTASDFDAMDESELLDVIQSGAHYWGPAKRLLTMWARQGIKEPDAESNLASAFDAVPIADRGKKWAKSRKDIPRWVKECYARALKRRGSAMFLQLLAKTEDEPHWKAALCANAFTETIEVSDPFPPKLGQMPGFHRAMRDEDALEALAYWQANGFPRVKKGTVWDVLLLAATRNSYHPVRGWLEGPSWDGQKRVARLFLDYFPGELPDDKQDQGRHDEVTNYCKHVAICFMVGAVARIFQPGCKLDTLPVLVSPQGFNKSQGLRALVPDPAWYSDDLSAAVWDRDAKESLVGKWIVELSEFPHIRKEIEKTKAFFSRQTDRYRRAYGRLNTDHPRQCVFCATANELEFLDVTGNRRCWPIPLAQQADVEAIERDREQLWAEAVYLYREGFKWWLSPSLEAIAGGMQDAFVEGDEWDEPIQEFIDDKTAVNNGTCPPFLLRDVLEHLGFGFTPGEKIFATKADEMRAARRLRRLGFRRDPHRSRSTAGRSPVWVPVKKITL